MALPSLAPKQTDIFVALRSFLVSILPAGVDVVQAQANRVPEPVGSDFVLMTLLRRERLSTNVDTYADCLFTASIAGTTLTVTNVNFGTIAVNNQVFCPPLLSAGTVSVIAFAGGTGGVGTYTISSPQTVSSQIMAAGIETLLQPTKVDIQLDVHGPNSSDNAQTISTLFRDQYAVSAFNTPVTSVGPFYADDPKQVPFINDQQQYETRWIIEACMQANQIVTVAEQFFATVKVTNIPADVIYPA